jgi:CO/xanthine dehydrogenase FAD-binding subunit
MKALDFKRPSDIEEAYALLVSQKKATVIAGGLFLRLQKQSHPLLVDLDGLGLDYIKEIKDGFIIGAMTTLRALEVSHLPLGITQSVKQVSGIGVRNMATIGGSISGRYPFSDINTALMAADAYLVFYKHGKISMRDYYVHGLEEKDILLEIFLKKPSFSMTKYFKKVYTDFSLVNVSCADDSIAIGARPGKTVMLEDINFNTASSELLKDISFKTDYRASGEYRRALAEALLEDILQERRTYGS